MLWMCVFEPAMVYRTFCWKRCICFSWQSYQLYRKLYEAYCSCRWKERYVSFFLILYYFEIYKSQVHPRMIFLYAYHCRVLLLFTLEIPQVPLWQWIWWNRLLKLWLVDWINQIISDWLTSSEQYCIYNSWREKLASQLHMKCFNCIKVREKYWKEFEHLLC